MANDTQTRTVSITMTGSGGSGVMTAGTMLLDAAARAGFYGYMTRSLGPQIRGGEAAAMIRIGTTPIDSHDDRFDLLVAIDWLNIERFAAEILLDDKSLIVGDASAGSCPDVIKSKGAAEANLALQDLAKEVPGGRPNMVALGATAAMIGVPKDAVIEIINAALARKGEEAQKSSVAAMEVGFAAAANLPKAKQLKGAAGKDKERWSITGNEATGLGAVRGGVRFVAAYPITPATEVLEWMAPALKKVGGVLVQAEDELASVVQIVGGSFGGTPSMTSTSGPGLALMMETIGLAVASETPIVVVDVQRGGPSTGIPVKSEQSDLNIALHGLHGDAPHLVLAANSIGDCLFTTQWAVHLAEAMQTAAIVLTDQSLGQSRAIINRPADLAFIAKREVPEQGALGEEYRRYAVTASGVSPMAIPGMAGGEYVADGLEHNPKGTPSSQATDHSEQMDKRERKLTQFNYGSHWADIEGEGEIAIVTWGSSTGPSREAAERLREEGVNVKLVSVRLLMPVQAEQMAEALKGVKRILCVEQTHSGQFHRYLRAYYDLPGELKAFSKPGPLAIRPAEIVNELTNWS